MDKHVTIEIFGHPFTFKAEKDISEAKKVANFLADEVKRVENQLSGKSLTISKRAILILAALNIANDYFECKRNHTEVTDTVTQRTGRLLKVLNEQLV